MNASANFAREFLSMPMKNTGLQICSYCGKKFYTKWHLRRHILSHTGEKPWKCDFCDFRSSHKHHLTRHRIVKHGVNFEAKPQLPDETP